MVRPVRSCRSEQRRNSRGPPERRSFGSTGVAKIGVYELREGMLLPVSFPDGMNRFPLQNSWQGYFGAYCPNPDLLAMGGNDGPRWDASLDHCYRDTG